MLNYTPSLCNHKRNHACTDKHTYNQRNDKQPFEGAGLWIPKFNLELMRKLKQWQCFQLNRKELL